MPGFLDLPNELLRMVASQAHHGNIVNLSLSSRLLYALSENALRRHNNNRDAYLPIRFGDVQQSPDPLRRPLPIIRIIIRDAEVAYYPIKIIIGDFTVLDNPSQITSNANNANFMGLDQILTRYGRRIRGLVASNNYIHRRAMWASIRAKEHGPATAFLDLTKTRNPKIIHGHPLAERIFIGSLRGFHLLRKLRADIMMFIESPLENLITKYAQIYREDSDEELEKRIKTTKKPLTDQARLLVDLLPASLEELGLCSTYYDCGQELDAMLGKASILKAQRLPHLHKIVFEAIPSIPEITRKAWNDVGVQVYWQALPPAPKDT